jgi:hypothetical protein
MGYATDSPSLFPVKKRERAAVFRATEITAASGEVDRIRNSRIGPRLRGVHRARLFRLHGSGIANRLLTRATLGRLGSKKRP